MLASDALGHNDPLWLLCINSGACAAELARRGLPARLQRSEEGPSLSGIDRAAQAGLHAEASLAVRLRLVSCAALADSASHVPHCSAHA